MKKQLYLSIFFFAITLCGRAQIKKGAILLGGTIGFNSQKTSSEDPANNSSKQSSVNLTPSIGKAIKDNLLAGIDLTYTGAKTTIQGPGPGESVSTTHTYGAGFFLRRYIYLGSGFAVFMQSRLGGYYNTQKNQSEGAVYPYSDIKGYSVDLSFYPGIAYAITKRVQLETGFQNLFDMNYYHSKNSSTDSNNATTFSKTNSFSLQTSLSSNLGFAVGIKVLLGS